MRWNTTFLVSKVRGEIGASMHGKNACARRRCSMRLKQHEAQESARADKSTAPCANRVSWAGGTKRSGTLAANASLPLNPEPFYQMNIKTLYWQLPKLGHSPETFFSRVFFFFLFLFLFLFFPPPPSSSSFPLSFDGTAQGSSRNCWFPVSAYRNFNTPRDDAVAPSHNMDAS